MALACVALLASACHKPANPGGTGGGGADLGASDLAGGSDLAGADLSSGDLAMPARDMTTPPDLLPPPDLGGVLDPAWIDPTGLRNLSNEGTSDWVHWGLADQNAVDRRSSGTPAITATVIGGATLHQYTDNHVTFNWIGGTPTASSSGTPTGIFVYAAGNGFSVSAPAETTPHTLRVYMSSFGADYTLTAHISDGSAVDYVDSVVNNVVGTGIYRMYTFTYKSLTPSQTFNVSWVNTFDHFGGSNVTLQAVTLQ